MEENNEYYINKAEVKSLDENGFVANRDLKGFYEKVLSVTGAGSCFLQDYWFRSIIEIASELHLGIRFWPSWIDEEMSALSAQIGRCKFFFVESELSFLDEDDNRICYFSIKDLSATQIASIIKSFAQ
jgi:hypothetical protein